MERKITIEDRLDQLVDYCKTLNEVEVAVRHFSDTTTLNSSLTYVRTKWKILSK